MGRSSVWWMTGITSIRETPRFVSSYQNEIGLEHIFCPPLNRASWASVRKSTGMGDPSLSADGASSSNRGAATIPALWSHRTERSHSTTASDGACGSYPRPPDGAADLVLARFGIPLRRGDAAMPQHALDFGEIGAVREHAPRQTMAQRVRGRPLKLAGQFIQLACAVERDPRHVGPQS